MATSVQACLPNSCKNQHSHQMKVSKSPNILRRSSMRQNTGILFMIVYVFFSIMYLNTKEIATGQRVTKRKNH